MMPTITVNYLAVFVCAIAAMPIGFLWFGRPESGKTARAMMIVFAGDLLIALVLAHSIEVWQASSWGMGPDAAPWSYGLDAAIWSWLGFFVPVRMGRVAWEMKRWGPVFVNAGFDLVRLVLFGLILAYWQ